MALRAGKPALVLPFIIEQRMWAARVKEVGAGDWLSFWRATVSSMTGARRIDRHPAVAPAVAARSTVWFARNDELGKPCELRRLGADGTVQESLRVPVEAISGVERTRGGDFWCGGEKGTLRLVRRKRGR